MLLTAPIIAISSPPGRSARGILRLSADNLSAVLPALLDPPPRPRELCVCRFRTFDLPCLALYHPAPHSYTGQDTLEIQLPGNPALLDRALHAVLDLLRGTTDGVPRFVPRSGQAVPAHDADPARLAEPGEFTRRAYLAGRIDLTRAEGVAATISAETDAQLHAARLLRTGRLGAWAVDLVDRLGQLLALVEVGIDFVDQDDVVAITPGDLDHGLAHVEQQLQNLMQRSRSWSSLEALPWVVLAGPPNAGKSTLFNTLLGHERAVTCDIAGTTRDVLTEPLRITTEHGDAAEVTLVDVAGIDTPRGMIDTSMQHAARAALDRADLVLWVEPTRASGGLPAGALAQCDGSPRNEGQHPGGQAASGAPDNIAAPILRVQSKSDLHTDTTADTSDTIHLSAVTGRGLDTLRRRIAEALADRAVSVSSQMLALTARHHDQLTACLADVAAARAMLTDQRDADTLADMELIADRMRAALDHLASVGGQLTPDDVIGKVFATFCVGK